MKTAIEFKNGAGRFPVFGKNPKNKRAVRAKMHGSLKPLWDQQKEKTRRQ